MERRGTKLDVQSGPYCKALMESGFELDFMAKKADPPLLIETEKGLELFVTKCLLLLVPVRAPAMVGCPSPTQAECHATIHLEMLAAEIERGECRMRDAYAEKCAETAWKMLMQRAPRALIARNGGPGA